MVGFSIDDVRESFERDVGAMLDNGRARLASILSGHSLKLGEADPELADLERLAAAFHGIHGTTALVDATSLASTAKTLEAAAESARASFQLAQSELNKARTQLAACERGLGSLGQMLVLELRGEREAANRLASEFREPSPPESSTRNSVLPSSDPVADELRAVFEGEALTILEEVAAILVQLDQVKPKRDDVSRLRRAFHTLKGAAAMVGLTRASDIAKAVNDYLEATEEAEGVESESLLRKVHGGARGVLEHAGLPTLLAHFHGIFRENGPSENQASALPVEDAQAQLTRELEAVFQQELTEARQGLAASFGSWQRSPASLKEPGIIARMMHQIKGAAATVGAAAAVGRAAELQGRLEAIVESEARVDRKFIQRAQRDVSALLTLGGAEPLSSAPAPSESGAAGVFAKEARDVLVEALRHATTRATIEETRTSNARLGQLFHRLKGSALIEGDPQISSLAGVLQQRAEAGELDAAALTRAIESLAGMLGVALETPSEAAREAPSEAGRDDGPRATSATAEVNIPPELWEAFEQELRDLTESIDAAVLGLEASADPRRDLASLLRLFHTLKGAVHTVGMSPTGRMLHLVEDLLEALNERAGTAPLGEVTRLLVFVQSEVRRQMRQARTGRVSAPLADVEQRIAKVLSQSADRKSQSRSEASARLDVSRSASDGSELTLLTGDGGAIRVPAARLDSLLNLAGELVTYRSKLWARVGLFGQLHRALDENRLHLLDVVDEFRVKNEFSLLQRQGAAIRGIPTLSAVAAGGTARAAFGFSELELDRYDDVNLLSRKIDELTNDVNEVSQALRRELSGFRVDAETLSTVIASIQGEVTRARMVPLETLFTRLRMPVRDAADREGREVRVESTGGDVALDKMVADALLQPLLHVVRNAVVHGIETPQERERRGKARTGVITLRAREDAGQIMIEIEDDGQGLALPKLRQLGIERGLLATDVSLDDPSVMDMVFASGISTRDKAGDVSGRGVGGDVVKRAVQRLNGRIEVQTTSGAGTRFTIFLPISLAISKALILQVGERTFALPLHFAERIVRAEDADWVVSAGARRIRLGDSLIGLFDLGSAIPRALARADGPVLILALGKQRFGIQVDKVVAQEEIVIKDLGDLLSNHPLFSGITVRGAGDLVLLLDASALFARHFRVEALPAREREVQLAPVLELPPAPPPEAAKLPLPKAELVVKGVVVDTVRRVLFVDDSLSVRKVAERMLEKIGVDVTLALDGADALDKLRTGEFDLVFTDLEMPRLNGFDLLRELRFLPAFQGLPVVVVSSRSGPKHQDQARALGANEYLTKPFTELQLKQVLTTLLGTKEQRRS